MSKEKLREIAHAIIKDSPLSDDNERIEMIYESAICQSAYWNDELKGLKDSIAELVKNACNC